MTKIRYIQQLTPEQETTRTANDIKIRKITRLKNLRKILGSADILIKILDVNPNINIPANIQSLIDEFKQLKAELE